MHSITQLSPVLAGSAKVAATKHSMNQFITAVVAQRFPQLVDQEDLLEWLVEEVLVSEGQAVWSCSDNLQDVIGQYLLDWGICSSDLEVSLACEDLIDLHSQPGERLLTLAAALQQGSSLQEAIISSASTAEEESDQPGVCMLCRRDLPLTQHHLFPKETHKKFVKRGLMTEADRFEKVNICRQCHNTVHRTFSNEELSTSYHSLSSLAEHSAIQRWVAFASKQKPRNMQHGMKTAR